MVAARQRSPLRDLSESQFLSLLSGEASLSRLKVHNLKFTLDNYVTLRDALGKQLPRSQRWEDNDEKSAMGSKRARGLQQRSTQGQMHDIFNAKSTY